MKRLTLILIALVMIGSTAVKAQETLPETTVKNKKTTFSKFYFGAINERLGFTEGEISGRIIDDSPTPDLLSVNVNLDSTNRATGFLIGLEFGSENRIHWSFDLSYSFNKEGKVFTGNFGLGYRIGSPKVHVIPMLKLGIGNGNFKLGDIQNESTFIQINDTEYYDDEISVRLKDFYAYAAPELNFYFGFNDRGGVQLSVGYKFSKNRKSKLSFDGSDDGEGGNPSAESRDLNDDQNQLKIDDVFLSKNAQLIDFGGIVFKASFVKSF